MAVLTGNPSGGVIALNALDVSRLFPGVMVAALGSGDVYKLTESLDAVDDDNVVAVDSDGSLRWLKQRISSDTATTKVLPGPDGNVQLGADGSLADDAESGFVTVPAVTDTFEQAEATIDEGHVAVSFQLVENRIAVFVPGGGWLFTAELTADPPPPPEEP